MGQVISIASRKVILPTFTEAQADCAQCELQPQCALNKTVYAYNPEAHGRPFNGIMLVGEGPGVTEVSQRAPFVGRAGRLLSALLEAAGIEREECWITNATLCLPPMQPIVKGQEKSFDQRFPAAVYACLPRLDAEIEYVRPKIIVPLGNAALAALTGYEVARSRTAAFDCSNGCDVADRKIGPVMQCAACAWFEFGETRRDACPKCLANMKRIRPKRIKCPTCGGKKRRTESYTTFEHDYKIGEVAGAIFRAETLAARLDEYGVKYVVPSYHPSYCLRSVPQGTKGNKRVGGQYAARVVVDHLEKALRLLKHEPRFRFVEPIVTSDPATVAAWLRTVGDDLVAVDIETESIDESKDGAWGATEITCVGFATARSEQALVVDTRMCLPLKFEDPLLDVLQLFLEDPDKYKIFHNGFGFDVIVLRRLFGITVGGYTDDTQVAHHGLYPDEPHNLAHVAFEMTDAEAWKPPKKGRGGCPKFESFEELARYNAKDTRLTALAHEVMCADHGRLDAAKTHAVYESDMVMARLAAQMSITGMPYDTGARDELRIEFTTTVTDHLDAMRVIVEREDFSPTSPKDLAWALFDPWGPLKLRSLMKTAGGRDSMAYDTLIKFAHEPFVQHLLAWRKTQKLLSTYINGDGLAPGSDGRVHPVWKVTTAVTGRWSSSPNFQNIPKALRALVVAPEGRVIVGWDYSQLEMRIMAAIAGDPELIRRCITADEKRKLDPDCDPHSYVASLAFGDAFLQLDMDDPTHDKKNPRCRCARCKRNALRDITKRVVYGLNYGAGAPTVLAAIYAGGYEGPPLNLQIIDRVTKIYFKAFSRVPVWRDAALKHAIGEREVRSPLLGRRRIFPLGDVEAPVVYNHPIQSGAADIMNTRLAVLMPRLPEADATAAFIAQVHDAIYVECAESRAEAVAACFVEALTTEVVLAAGAPPMLFTGSAKIGKTWQQVS